MATYPFSDSTFYDRKFTCPCGNVVAAGKTVYGDVINGRFLSHRHCRECEDKAIKRRIAIRRKGWESKPKKSANTKEV